MKIARQSENPRAIEVMSVLMKDISNISKNLVTLNKDKSDAKAAKIAAKIGKSNQVTPTIGTQNIIFSGSSSELNKLISNQCKVL